MFKAIGKFAAGLLGTEKATNLAIDLIADKAGLNDMNDKDKAQFILDYLAATKHQSPIRRLLAIIVIFTWATLILSWAVLCAVGNMLEVSGAITTASLYFNMIKEVSQYLAGLLAFYFANGAIDSWRSK